MDPRQKNSNSSSKANLNTIVAFDGLEMFEVLGSKTIGSKEITRQIWSKVQQQRVCNGCDHQLDQSFTRVKFRYVHNVS